MAGSPPEDDVSSSKGRKRWYLDTSLLYDYSTTDYIINRAVQRATEPILQDVQDLKDEVAQLRVTVANLEAKNAALEATQDTQAENELNMLRLINDVRKGREPQPMQRDRGEILRALIVANNGKMLATEARKKMHLDRATFSRLLATMKDDIEVKPYHLHKNWKVLALR